MVPILINYPEEMLRVRIAALKDSSSAALADLQKLGVLHVEEAKELSPPEVEEIASRKQRTRKAIQEIDEILDSLRGVREVAIPPLTAPMEPADAMGHVDALKGRLSSLLERREGLRTRINALDASARFLEALALAIDVPLADLRYTGPYLFSRVIIFPREATGPFLEDAGDLLLHRVEAQSGGEDVIYLLARAHDRDRIERTAVNLGGSQLPPMDEDMTLREFNTRRRTIKEELVKSLTQWKEIFRPLSKNSCKISYSTGISSRGNTPGSISWRWRRLPGISPCSRAGCPKAASRGFHRSFPAAASRFSSTPVPPALMTTRPPSSRIPE